jgi:hypothetical protein
MLLQLLSLLQQHPAGLDVGALCRELRAPPGLVLAMLDTLVRKGRLQAIGPDGGVCSSCSTAVDCRLLALKGQRYFLARPSEL